MKQTIAIAVIVFAVIVLWWGFEPGVRDDIDMEEERQNDDEEITTTEDEQATFLTAAENLNVPWELAFLPDGQKLVTQRPGALTLIDNNGEQTSIDTNLDIRDVGEGGLLGLTLDPDFQNNNRLYVYATKDNNGDFVNQVLSFQFENDELSNKEVLIDNIPGNRFHNGGRIAFGPDGYLYITTGDAEDTDLSQDRNSLAGKILRINADGSIPDDNPFDDEIFSYGHRNPQGLTWDEEGRLWSTEHGPVGFDEINLIEAGGNYGWPIFKGDEINEVGQEIDHIEPKANSGPSSEDTWAPAGVVYLNDSLFFGGLRGSALFEAQIVDEDIGNINQHLQDEYGRIRLVKIGPDGYIYIGTSNQDGRGQPDENDDKIIRISPEILN